MLEEIIEILKHKIGLNPGSIGKSSIERAINHRISCRNCINSSEYLALLKHDAKEVRELIEEVVVPETWFFRNKTPFEAFKNHFINELLPNSNRRKSIRILSVPCATGEEPYSLAITLIEANVDPQAFRIEAIDVSKKALELAKDAHYGKNSFRDVDPRIQEKYFAKTERGWLLDDSIKKLVKFKQGNVLQMVLSPHPGYYDVVFCRNLMIYFDRKTQQLALEKLYRSLKKGAILFVGHAECSQVTDKYFQLSPYPKSFSFIKREKPLEKSAAMLREKLKSKPPLKKAGSEGKTGQGIALNAAALTKGKNPPPIRRSVIGANNHHEKREVTEDKPVMQSLRPVEKLANDGHYEEARKLCEKFLVYHPESAHGHYLLGLINHSEGNQKAAESLLKKAIYLDPNHEPALVLSCLLAEQKGNEELVLSFKRRIERVKNRKR